MFRLRRQNLVLVRSEAERHSPFNVQIRTQFVEEGGGGQVNHGMRQSDLGGLSPNRRGNSENNKYDDLHLPFSFGRVLIRDGPETGARQHFQITLSGQRARRNCQLAQRQQRRKAQACEKWACTTWKNTHVSAGALRSSLAGQCDGSHSVEVKHKMGWTISGTEPIGGSPHARRPSANSRRSGACFRRGRRDPLLVAGLRAPVISGGFGCRCGV